MVLTTGSWQSLTKRILEFVKDVEEKLVEFPDEIEWEEGSEVTDELEETYSELLQEVLNEISEYYGTEINYLMWLGNLDVILWNYLDDFDDIENGLKAYKTGYLILEDVTGNLYGYKEKPVPVENGAIEKLKELKRGWYPLFVLYFSKTVLKTYILENYKLYFAYIPLKP